MSGCVGNIRTKNYQNLIIGFQVTAKNVGDVFLGHSVDWRHMAYNQSITSKLQKIAFRLN